MSGIRAKIPRCPRCQHPEFQLGKAADERPSFTCTKCKHYWTNGRDGGLYFKYAKVKP